MNGLEAARTHPERFAIMGRINPEAPESRGKLATWHAQPGMLGLRYAKAIKAANIRIE